MELNPCPLRWDFPAARLAIHIVRTLVNTQGVSRRGIEVFAVLVRWPLELSCAVHVRRLALWE